MKIRRKLTMNTLMTMLKITVITTLFALTGCSEGPAEDAGERIDDAITDAKNKAEDLCEKAKEEIGSEDKNC
jgi:hypothetical protein